MTVFEKIKSDVNIMAKFIDDNFEKSPAKEWLESESQNDSMTNFDKIKSVKIDEAAKLLNDGCELQCDVCPYYDDEHDMCKKCGAASCQSAVEKILKSKCVETEIYKGPHSLEVRDIKMSERIKQMYNFDCTATCFNVDGHGNCLFPKGMFNHTCMEAIMNHCQSKQESEDE